MFSFTLAFLLGDLLLQQFSYLPAKWYLISLSLLCIPSLLLQKKFSYSYLFSAFIFGFVYAALFAYAQLSWTLPKNLETKPLTVTGYVTSLPVKDNMQTSFIFLVKTLTSDHLITKPNAIIRLALRDTQLSIKVGQEWRFTVRLKRIHSMQNPGSFDYEAYALQTGLRASGYVVANGEEYLIANHADRYPMQHLREKIRDKLANYLPKSATANWLLALMIGERNGIPADEWRVLRNTGTNHLMAIGGLHIGIVAGFIHFIVVWIWRRFSRLTLWLPATHAGAIAALITALIYGALSGFAIPAERAFIMLSVFVFALISRRKINPWHAFAIALLIVLLINPLTMLSESIWLSFGTIALIIYGMQGRVGREGIWWKWGRVQWVIGFGLIPLSLMLFQQCSFVSFIANSIAIPWLVLFILPFCLLAMLCLFITPTVTYFLLFLADKSLAMLWTILTWLSHLPLANWHHAISNSLMLVVTIIGIILLLAPRGLAGKWLGGIWLLPLLLQQPTVPEKNNFSLTLLDVGQGLSAIIQTEQHILIFDAGAKFNDNVDMGENIVVPYLHLIGIKKIDMVVVSHGDNDHRGGVGAVINAFPTLSLLTSVPDEITEMHANYCLANTTWNWDGVHFTFLHPSEKNLDLGNDSSCVLKIDNGQQSVLLTGDIEKFAEQTMLTAKPEALAATILVAPHHGSKTSGDSQFIAAVHPAYVLYATGYRNRYHFPNNNVQKKYEALNATQLNTAATGAIKFLITKDKPLTSAFYRQMHHRYWYDE